MLTAVDPQHPLLKTKELDDYAKYIMFVFGQLDRDRPYGAMGGAMPFGLQSISSYCNLFRDQLTPDEILLLQRLDIVYINKQYELKKAEGS